MTISIKSPEDHNVILADVRARIVSVERGNLLVFPDRPIDRECLLSAGAIDNGPDRMVEFPLTSIGEFTIYAH